MNKKFVISQISRHHRLGYEVRALNVALGGELVERDGDNVGKLDLKYNETDPLTFNSLYSSERSLLSENKLFL